MTKNRSVLKQLGSVGAFALGAALAQPVWADIVFAPPVFQADGTVAVSLEVTDAPITADALTATLGITGPLTLIDLTPAPAYEDKLFPSGFDDFVIFLFDDTTILSTGTLLTWTLQPASATPWSAQLNATVDVEVIGSTGQSSTIFTPSATVTAVPEPGTFAGALAMLGLLLVGMRRRC